MKTASPALAAHYAQGTTTLARCWLCTRTDGAVYAFTDAVRPFRFDGVLYEAATGMTPSAIETRMDMSVANLDVVGFLSSLSITEADLLRGLWDDAEVEIFEVNRKALADGKLVLAYGRLGAVVATEVGFTAEIRGLAQLAQQPVGGVYGKNCDANLGDARCGVDVEALRVSGAVTTVTSRSGFDTDLAAAADYFGAGLLTWVTGDNAGARVEVFSADAAGNLTLAYPMPGNVAIGDTFTIVPGCRKRLTEDCATKFNNVVRFRGFPHTPLNDRLLGQGGTES